MTKKATKHNLFEKKNCQEIIGFIFYDFLRRNNILTENYKKNSCRVNVVINYNETLFMDDPERSEIICRRISKEKIRPQETKYKTLGHFLQ